MSVPQINLFDLPIPQLQAVGAQLDEEIQVLTNSFAKLKQAQAKFVDAQESLKKLVADKDVLVPLTNSLYVKGQLEDPEKVIVDIGTGYYVEKKIPNAIEYYKKKIGFVKGNLAQLELSINQRSDQKKVLISTLQQKISMESKKQESNPTPAN